MLKLMIKNPCECKRCGYKWIARVESPKKCPVCLHREWRTPKPKKIEKIVLSEL